MSGGCLDYLYLRVNDVAIRIIENGKSENKLNFIAFGEHLKKVANALHDVEYVMSGDYGQDDADESIKKCITCGELEESAIKHGKDVLEALQKILKLETKENV